MMANQATSLCNSKEIIRTLWTSSYQKVLHHNQAISNRQEIRVWIMEAVDLRCNFLRLRNFLWSQHVIDHRQTWDSISNPVNRNIHEIVVKINKVARKVKINQYSHRQVTNRNHSSIYLCSPTLATKPCSQTIDHSTKLTNSPDMLKACRIQNKVEMEITR